jgi:hypothetical protein
MNSAEYQQIVNDAMHAAHRDTLGLMLFIGLLIAGGLLAKDQGLL